MAGWGLGKWGLSPWGIGQQVVFDCPPADPPLQIIVREPIPNSSSVTPQDIVKIAFFDADSDLDPSTMYITVNGQTAYGGGSFLNQFAGTVTPGASITSIQFVNPLGWDYSTRYIIRAYIANSIGECVDEQWHWSTVADPVCYSGLTPLPIELAIQLQLDTFLDVEFLRKLLLDVALRTGGRSINERDNKAARVIYQLAFSTELSTIQNLYVAKDADALKTIVCEREKAQVIDQEMFKYEARIRAAVLSFINRGIVTEQYAATFNDYLDSTNYNFRASTIANLVLLAKAIELNEAV